MHPGEHAAVDPSRPAVIMAASGDVLTYGEMENAANQFARLLSERGLRAGDHIAVLLENHLRYFEIVWGALRSGIYVTPINWHLGAEEAGYIIEDCGAQVFVTSSRFASLAEQLATSLSKVDHKFSIDGLMPSFESYEEAVASLSTEPLDETMAGAVMFYSSGTTGRPKGIKPPLSADPYGTPAGVELLMTMLYGFTSDSRYLCPAPLYHAAPLVYSTSCHRVGCTVVVMEHFDAAQCLSDIQNFHISHAQFVPTHFVRMLKLPDDERKSFDVSSLTTAIHAAAPCPVEVKKQMFDWWGPIIWEYYAGSEGNGYCSASPQEWLAHPGTVGRMFTGSIHIIGDDATEVPTGEAGQIWFESGAVFEYHNDPDKTKSAFNDVGWSTLGDIGYLDDDGFVYLTDRVSHMIISGGVNIYPQEIENLLVMHAAVADVAVIGVPDEDLGEVVKAVVQVAPGVLANDALATVLLGYCREHLAKFKCPRSVDFVDELPRLESGKLLKRRLIDQYRSASSQG